MIASDPAKTRRLKDRLHRRLQAFGLILAETLEDKEGWHGEDRAESVKDFGTKGF